MADVIGIRREDKNIWERRVPLTPQHVKELAQKHGIQTVIQPFERRAFRNGDYVAAGAKLKEDLNEASAIFAVKEIPIELIHDNKVYTFFSHTIKGQDYNMPLLQKIIDSNSTLIDYECITDDNGRRLVFFGRYAGLAGMIDTFHGMGKRFNYLGYKTPFMKIKPAYEYKDVNEAKEHISEVGKEIKKYGLPKELLPLTVGFAGYGNVSKGAQEIFDLMPFEEITAEELLTYDRINNKNLVKVVFKEKDMVVPKDENAEFELQEYFTQPEKYKSVFSKYLDKLTVLINAIFWNDNYPRFITKEFVKSNPGLKLQLIGDITCDIDGAMEFTCKSTEPDNPAFVYNPKTDTYTDGYEGEGIVTIAVDNLPTEIPRDSSLSFSESLVGFVPGIVGADYSKSFAEVDLPDEIKRAVIVYKGKLTPDYVYLEEYLK